MPSVLFKGCRGGGMRTKGFCVLLAILTPTLGCVHIPVAGKDHGDGGVRKEAEAKKEEIKQMKKRSMEEKAENKRTVKAEKERRKREGLMKEVAKGGKGGETAVKKVIEMSDKEWLGVGEVPLQAVALAECRERVGTERFNFLLTKVKPRAASSSQTILDAFDEGQGFTLPSKQLSKIEMEKPKEQKMSIDLED